MKIRISVIIAYKSSTFEQCNVFLVLIPLQSALFLVRKTKHLTSYSKNITIVYDHLGRFY